MTSELQLGEDTTMDSDSRNVYTLLNEWYLDEATASTLSPELQQAIRNDWSGSLFCKFHDRLVRLEFASDGKFNYGMCRSIGHSAVNGETAWGDMSGGSTNNGQDFGVYYEFWINGPTNPKRPIKRLYAWWPDLNSTDARKALIRYDGTGKVRIVPFRDDKMFYARTAEQLEELQFSIAYTLERIRKVSS